AELAGEFNLACELFDIANGDIRVLADTIETATDLSIVDWLCTLPGELSDVSMHEEALDLARRVQTALGDENIQIQLPGLLLHCHREQEARAVLAENLVEFPQDPLVQLEAAELELALGNAKQAESHFREALKWVGTELELRECILDGLVDLLVKTNQEAALLALHQKEEAYIMAYFPPPRAEAASPPNAQATVRREAPKVGRNDPCPCGSGKKSKKCCGAAN
ncbi:MAG TPA: SEC-C metal-binding domain-containing protein, partial [Polyangiaceae bacterium]